MRRRIPAPSASTLTRHPEHLAILDGRWPGGGFRRLPEASVEKLTDIAAADSEAASEQVSDLDIDRMIVAEAQAEHEKEMGRLGSLRAELDALKAEGREKQK